MPSFVLDAPLVAVGLATGFLSGLFGVGGGFLIVPALVLLGWEMPDAVGTSLFYVTLVGAAGALAHGRRRNVDGRLVFLCALPAIVGAQLGAHLTDLLPAWVMDLCFAALLVYAGLQLDAPDAPDGAEAAPPSAGASVVLGGLVGVLSGLLGVGGGVMLVPAQTRWLGVPIVRAIGNSLAVVVLTGVSGVAAHVARGHVSWVPGVWLVASGMVGLQVGLTLLRRVSLALLRRSFTGLLLLLAGYMGFAGYRAAPYRPVGWVGAAPVVHVAPPPPF